MTTNPFDKIDMIYYINLDKRTDRKADILSELHKMNINPNKIKRISGVITKMGCLGCSQAHLNCLKDFKLNNYQTCLIIEDDFIFKHNKQKTYELLFNFWDSNTMWDVVMFSGNIIKYQQEKPNLYKVNDGQTTSGYMVNKHFVDTLINNYTIGIQELSKYNKPQHNYCLDIHWKKLQPSSKWYIIYPKLGYQRAGYSDIEKRNVDYKIEHTDI